MCAANRQLLGCSVVGGQPRSHVFDTYTCPLASVRPARAKECFSRPRRATAAGVMSGMSVASGRTTKTGATGDGEETSWILDVVVRDKCIKVSCGSATQRVKWLGHVGIARYDEKQRVSPARRPRRPGDGRAAGTRAGSSSACRRRSPSRTAQSSIRGPSYARS